ncbi:MAG: hypothetical protein NT105_05935 [Verrucomicrobia bacterium]|nr:hypothetical protein [Verrucomicrobiota bacterium]
MKKLLMLIVVAGIAISASAQSPVQVTVQRVSKRKSAQGDIRSVGNTTYYSYNTANASLTLRITIQNISARPIEDMVVRWGVAKMRLSGTSHTADVAYGKEEKCSLKSKESKVIETETVEASRSESQLTDNKRGEKIRGHGVQVLIGGRVMWEEFVPPTVKKSFENLRPVGDQEKEEDQEKPTKKKKK